MTYECVDRWWPGACTQAALDAYKRLIQDGRIAVRRVEVGRYSGKMTVYYLADRPQQQIRAMLAAEKEGKSGDGKRLS